MQLVWKAMVRWRSTANEPSSATLTSDSIHHLRADAPDKTWDTGTVRRERQRAVMYSILRVSRSKEVITPTGKPLQQMGIIFAHYNDQGQNAESYYRADNFSFLTQPGILKPQS